MNAILIIDDDWAIRESLTDILSVVTPRLRVLCAANGQKGVELACAERPDLILLDGQMPGMNGAQVAGLLRQTPATSRIPLVAITGYDASSEAASDLYRLCDAWLSKPLSPDCLLGLIHHLFEPTNTNNHNHNHNHSNGSRPKHVAAHAVAARPRAAATLS